MTVLPVVSLRPITPEDNPFLARVYASTRQEELAPVPWSEAQKAAFLQMQFDSQAHEYTQNYPGAQFDVILADDLPAGRLYVHRRPQEIRIMDIALLPEYRRLGIGTRLLQNLLVEGRETHRAVSIHVERNNPALNLYQRLGFRLAEDRGVYLFLVCAESSSNA
jgi:ribosomal protein S18 acetylase RimI-like enzyme